jgi:hypothetical protein
MRVIEDKDGDKFLEFESKEDLEEFRRIVIEACKEIRCNETTKTTSKSGTKC